MSRKIVERQLRLMPLGEVDSGDDSLGGGVDEDISEDRWDGVMREITRIVARMHFAQEEAPVLEANASGA